MSYKFDGKQGLGLVLVAGSIIIDWNTGISDYLGAFSRFFCCPQTYLPAGMHRRRRRSTEIDLP